MSDPLIYDTGTDYIGYVEMDNGESAWYRWPAKQGGWRERQPCPSPTESADCVELPSFNARLALRLSGVSES